MTAGLTGYTWPDWLVKTAKSGDLNRSDFRHPTPYSMKNLVLTVKNVYKQVKEMFGIKGNSILKIF
jgi:hypothetical protein